MLILKTAWLSSCQHPYIIIMCNIIPTSKVLSWAILYLWMLKSWSIIRVDWCQWLKLIRNPEGKICQYCEAGPRVILLVLRNGKTGFDIYFTWNARIWIYAVITGLSYFPMRKLYAIFFDPISIWNSISLYLHGERISREIQYSRNPNISSSQSAHHT